MKDHDALRRRSLVIGTLAISVIAGPLDGGGAVPVAHELQKFAPADGAASDHYGSDVVIDGDLMAIGSRDDEQDTGSGAGSIYVYRRVGDTWSFEQKLIADEQIDFAQLGISVDVDADAGLIVGGASTEPQFLPGGGTISSAGAAYVFRHDGVKWVQEQRLAASDQFTFDTFGRDVAVEGTRIVVGAHEEGSACDGTTKDPFELQNCNSGAAYVFEHDGGKWVETQKLVASDTAVRDLFGESLDLQGDVIAVAAWNAGNTSGPCFPTCANFDGHGAVYIFRYDGAEWVEEAILLGDDPTVGSWDNFGSDVALSGEWLIAGASGDDDAALNAGAAYIFRNEGGEPGRWSMHAKLTPPDGELGDFLGEGADIEGDLAVVGSQSDDIDGVPAVGSAYVWQRTGESWDLQGKLVASDGNEFDFAGNWVSIENHQAAVGVNLNDSTAPEAGAVYLYGSLDDCDGDGILDLFDDDECAIPGDLDGDGSVGFSDLLLLLSDWGPCPAPPDPCPADLDANGTVGLSDLLILLTNWGPGP